MSILIETEEDIRRSKLFTDSLNATWRKVLDDRYTPALLCYKSCKPGRLEYAQFGWSMESERVEREAEEQFLKLTAEDGVYDGVSLSYGRWIGVSESEQRRFYDDIQEAHGLHYFELDKAIALLRSTIARVQGNVCPQFPPIAELYFDLAFFYHDHKRYDEHDAAFEEGLAFYLQNLEQRPGYFGPRVADSLMKLAKVYLSRDQVTAALGTYARLKALKSLVPKDVAAQMNEDWLSFARYYERHSQIDEATACYKAVVGEIDWARNVPYHELQKSREVASSLIKLGRPIEAEEIYEQILEWGFAHDKFKKEKSCFHMFPCQHWFEPYFASLREQKRLEHLSQICKRLDIDALEHLHQRPQEDYFGYIDRQGNWAIPQRFEKAEGFNDGVAKVDLAPHEANQEQQQHCLIDKTGKIVGPNPESWDLAAPSGYAQHHKLYYGLIVVRKNENRGDAYGSGSEPGDYGYADANGNIVIEARFTEARPFYEGTAIVGIGGRVGGFGSDVIHLSGAKYGLIDRSGNYLIEPQFTRLQYYADPPNGLFSYVRDNESGVVAASGEIRSVLVDCQDTFYLHEGMANVAWGEIDETQPLAEFGYGRKYGYLDAEGRILIEPRFEYASSFEKDRAEVKLGGKYGFINRSGEIVIDPVFDQANGFERGLARVKIGEHWGCINEAGEWIVEAVYDDLKLLESEHLVARKADKFALLDTSGKLLCDACFDKIERFVDGFAVVTRGGLKGLIDTTGALIVGTQYQDARTFSEELACAAVLDETGSLVWGFVGMNGTFVIEPVFAEAKSFNDGLAAVRCIESRLWGFIDRHGKFVVEPQFDTADSFYDERARVCLSGVSGDKLFGIIDTAGNYMLPAEYHEVGIFREGLCVVGRKKRQ